MVTQPLDLRQEKQEKQRGGSMCKCGQGTALSAVSLPLPWIKRSMKPCPRKLFSELDCSPGSDLVLQGLGLWAFALCNLWDNTVSGGIERPVLLLEIIP